MPVIQEVATDSGKFMGYMAWCPGCEFMHVIYTMRDPKYPKRPCWDFNGDMVHPTFTPSLLVSRTYGDNREPRRCHSFIKGGKWEFLNDSTHHLAGKIVDMVDVDTKW